MSLFHCIGCSCLCVLNKNEHLFSNDSNVTYTVEQYNTLQLCAVKFIMNKRTQISLRLTNNKKTMSLLPPQFSKPITQLINLIYEIKEHL